ncbi:hypothetical protein HDV06_006575 [Boothiomyces sp. JEL0866]|nr:hypothetical protein HDV06_006575 [Boothiomyces sp. JEL0866]
MSLFTLALLYFAFCSPIHEAHDVPLVKRNGEHLPFWYPSGISKIFTPQVSRHRRRVDLQDAIATAIKYTAQELGISKDELQVQQAYRESSIDHIYLIRKINGVKVDNHNAQVHLKDGQPLSFSSSFSGKSIVRRSLAPIPADKPIVSLAQAVQVAEKQYGAPKDDFPASMVYLQVPSGKLVYCHQFQLKNMTLGKWYQVSVDSATSQTIQVVDYVSHFASYNVIKLPKANPDDGFEIVSDPSDKTASPLGWHQTPTNSFTDTQGNNVDSKVKRIRPDGGSTLTFDSKFDIKDWSASTNNINSAITNSFYLANMIHDISYMYGFTEEAGNFQSNNFGKGGLENDAVVIKNYASGGFNNARFVTPPDGQTPEMYLFLFTHSDTERATSFENAVVLHEYTHGISERLTGGSRQGNCLESPQANGMGEGWSDAVAVFLLRKEGENRSTIATVGSWVTERSNGLRPYPYSTNMQDNPFTFKYILHETSEHVVGTIWATMLYELYWNLVDKYGFTPNYHDPSQMKGNVMALRLLIGGLTMQPCNPTFVTARDAIIAADTAYYEGKNRCLIWKAFAKRGLGIDVVTETSKLSDGHKIPPECN